ncbi:unnamed protein product [Arctia plantaginis]|uniref:Uncharacterized protein n=1 Tax=Arctia plantaginis TaxID=874455 RepID=A0A8S0ZKW5_ARCPL|nr:unnamed protein product [Arctia plantaginis]
MNALHGVGADGAMTVARDEGSPERLGGALRRLHYKATRRAHSAAARHHNNTPPKVRLLYYLLDKTEIVAIVC